MTALSTLTSAACATAALVVTFATTPPAFAATTQSMGASSSGCVQALSDLRSARGYLEHVTTASALPHQKHALEEVDAAMTQIKKVGADDGQTAMSTPPADTNLQDQGRVHKARDLLAKAHSDCSQDKVKADATDAQHQALQHIDVATNALDNEIAAIQK